MNVSLEWVIVLLAILAFFVMLYVFYTAGKISRLETIIDMQEITISNLRFMRNIKHALDNAEDLEEYKEPEG